MSAGLRPWASVCSSVNGEGGTKEVIQVLPGSLCVQRSEAEPAVERGGSPKITRRLGGIACSGCARTAPREGPCALRGSGSRTRHRSPKLQRGRIGSNQDPSHSNLTLSVSGGRRLGTNSIPKAAGTPSWRVFPVLVPERGTFVPSRGNRGPRCQG